MEARGVEPLSEDIATSASTGVSHDFDVTLASAS